MRRLIQVLIVLGLFFVSTAGYTEVFISGTYKQGTNITEPKPVKSKHMATEVGGVAASELEGKYVLYVNIVKPFNRSMFVKSEFQNPLDNTEPFVEQGEIPPGHRELSLIHGPVKGLKIHRSYWVKVYVYELDNRETPVDVLTQNIKSYIDTTGDRVLFKSGLVSK